MQILFTKHSDREHDVTVVRTDASREQATLTSRDFLRHDFAHLCVEQALSLRGGYWGSVAAGAALDGMGIRGGDIILAESLAGPVQTLMRLDAGIDEYESMLQRIRPELASRALAENIHERARQLQGHWRATPYGGDMVVQWPDA